MSDEPGGRDAPRRGDTTPPTTPAVLEAVAVRACRAGGRYVASRFRQPEIDAEYGPDDVKAAVDVEAEERIVATIREAYPGHAIHTEEAGRLDGDPDTTYEWTIDPLDGTNNLAAGIPCFATAVAVSDEDGPVCAVIHEPLAEDCYVARRGAGARVGEEPLDAESTVALEHGTVSLVIGRAAVRDPDRGATGDGVRAAIDGTCKRVFAGWAPCVDYGLLGRGAIEGLVVFHPDPFEYRAGDLLAREADAHRVELADGDCVVYASSTEVLAALRDAIAPRLD